MFKMFFSKNTHKVAENWHEEFIPLLASITEPKVYVELGLYKCELFNKMIPYADKLIGIDINAQAGNYMKKSPKTHFIHASTKQYALMLKKKPLIIDLLFIDADHSRNNVVADFKRFFPYVREQGMILLHDTYPKSKKYVSDSYCSDAYRAAVDLAACRGCELVTIPRHPGLTLIRKRRNQLAWRP